MTETVLEARGITFEYELANPILFDWDAQFRTGEIVAVTGPSGRGKSTLLYLLGLMLKPTAGQLLVNGVDATQLRDGRRARLRAEHFGFVFQDAALDATRSVLANVTETALYRGENPTAAGTRALQLMDRFGVSVRAQHKPGQVSGGQAQRIALCRALLNNPRILLADEPTGNLDPDSAAVVFDAMRDQARSGGTVVVATHDRDLVTRCDRVISL